MLREQALWRHGSLLHQGQALSDSRRVGRTSAPTSHLICPLQRYALTLPVCRMVISLVMSSKSLTHIQTSSVGLGRITHRTKRACTTWKGTSGTAITTCAARSMLSAGRWSQLCESSGCGRRASWPGICGTVSKAGEAPTQSSPSDNYFEQGFNWSLTLNSGAPTE